MYEMGDPVPVVPRFSEQPSAPPAVPIAAAVAGTQTDTGLFTSFYENRTIVFLIVIVVLLLGFAALWMSKGSTEDNPPKNVQGAPAVQAAPAATQQTQDTQTPQAASVCVPPVAPQQTKDELENLLTQARAPTPTAPAPIAPQPNNVPIYSSKSDAELMHFMEDTPAQPSPTDVIQCSAIVPPNRRCKNPAVANGKCTQHDKA